MLTLIDIRHVCCLSIFVINVTKHTSLTRKATNLNGMHITSSYICSEYGRPKQIKSSKSYRGEGTSTIRHIPRFRRREPRSTAFSKSLARDVGFLYVLLCLLFGDDI